MRNTPDSCTGRCRNFSGDTVSERCNSVTTPIIQNKRKTHPKPSQIANNTNGEYSCRTYWPIGMADKNDMNASSSNSAKKIAVMTALTVPNRLI